MHTGGQAIYLPRYLIKVQFHELDVLPGKTENKQDKSNLFPPTKGYFKEMCKSKNENPISLVPMSSLSIVQIIIKSLSTIVCAYFNENILICTISISDLLTRPRGQGSTFSLICWSILLSL